MKYVQLFVEINRGSICCFEISALLLGKSPGTMCSCPKGMDRLLSSAIGHQQERLMLMARQATQGIIGCLQASS